MGLKVETLSECGAMQVLERYIEDEDFGDKFEYNKILLGILQQYYELGAPQPPSLFDTVLELLNSILQLP
jgi:hypothetical protein